MRHELYPTYQMTLGGPNPLRSGTQATDEEMQRRQIPIELLQLMMQQGGGAQQGSRVEQKTRSTQEAPPSQTATQVTEGLVQAGVTAAASAIPFIGPFIAPLLGGLAGTAAGGVAAEASGEGGEMERYMRSRGGEAPGLGSKFLQSAISGAAGGVTGGTQDYLSGMKNEKFQNKLLAMIAGGGGGGEGGGAGGAEGFFGELYGMPGLDMKGQAGLAQEAAAAGLEVPSWHEMFDDKQVFVKGEDGSISVQDFVADPAKMGVHHWSQAHIDDEAGALKLFMSGLAPVREKAEARAVEEVKLADKMPKQRSEMDLKFQALQERARGARERAEVAETTLGTDIGGGPLFTGPGGFAQDYRPEDRLAEDAEDLARLTRQTEEVSLEREPKDRKDFAARAALNKERFQYTHGTEFTLPPSGPGGRTDMVWVEPYEGPDGQMWGGHYRLPEDKDFPAIPSAPPGREPGYQSVRPGQGTLEGTHHFAGMPDFVPGEPYEVEEGGTFVPAGIEDRPDTYRPESVPGHMWNQEKEGWFPYKDPAELPQRVQPLTFKERVDSLQSMEDVESQAAEADVWLREAEDQDDEELFQRILYENRNR